MSVKGYPVSVKQLYRWTLDQIADWGDTGVEWNLLVTFGKTIAGLNAAQLECCLADLLNSRRVYRNCDGRLVVRD